MIPTEIDSIIRVATKAVAQDDNTPESERMCCRHLLRLAIPLLEQARIAGELAAIRLANSRAEAEQVRNRVVAAAQSGRRSRTDWDAVCSAVIERWGPAALGSYSEGFARTGD